MLTLDADWHNTMRRSGSEPRILLEIDDDTNQWYAQSGICDNVDTGNIGAVFMLTPMGSSYDPKTKRVQISRMTITVADSWIRPIVSGNRLKGSKVTVFLGDKKTAHTSFASTSFATAFVGVIDEVIPEPGGEMVHIEALDTWSLVSDQEIQGYWINDHPLEVVEDILTNKIGIDSSLLDTTKMDPSHADNASNSHLVVYRASLSDAGDSTVWEPEPAFDLIHQLLQIVDGMLVVGEDGKISVKIFDPTASSVADWDDDTIDQLRQTDMGKNMVNEVSVPLSAYKEVTRVARQDQNGDYYLVSEPKGTVFYNLKSTDSQSNYAAGVLSTKAATQVINNPWIMTTWAHSWALSQILQADTSIGLGGMLEGFCGTRGTIGSQPSDAKPTSGRPVYLMITENDTAASISEIVKITSQYALPTNPVYVSSGLWYPDPTESTGIGVTSYLHVGHIVATIARSQLGTTAPVSHGSAPGTYPASISRIVDITAAEFMARKIIERYGDGGAPEIEVDVPLSEFYVQLGDLVTVTNDSFIAYGADGVDNTTKWEVTGKEIHVFGAKPHITFTLVRATVGSPTYAHRTWTNDLRRNESINDHEESFLGELHRPIIAQGLSVSQDTGLTGAISAGRLKSLKKSININDVSHDYTASKDTYVFMDSVHGGIVNIEYSTGSTRPDPIPGLVPLGKVTTDGSGITSIQDYTVESSTDERSLTSMKHGSWPVGCPNGGFNDW